MVQSNSVPFHVPDAPVKAVPPHVDSNSLAKVLQSESEYWALAAAIASAVTKGFINVNFY